eukprot:GHRR01010553.1.p1 GENE.GHRR01010553.1~~GHRR01010553.1.p1  ORF type:complete len:552 (+),score=265.30 GHRR01010553.1:262-1917(+)
MCYRHAFEVPFLSMFIVQCPCSCLVLQVAALQAVMELPEEEASAQLIIERFSRYPAILARSVEALEAQLSSLAELLGSDLQRAARLAFKVPALAASSGEELKRHMDLLSELLGLDTEAVRGLVLRQPSLLARTTEGLQSKVEAYANIFGQEYLGQALAAAPQLLTMKVEAVSARYDLLKQLVQLQPAWSNQLAEASMETLAVWLCSSEKKLRRLEIAAQHKRLARLQLYRILSHSEGRWANEMASAGVTADGAGSQSQATAAPGAQAGQDEVAAQKPKRPRGGRRERERQERAAARAAAAAAGGNFPAAASSSRAPLPPPVAASPAAGTSQSQQQQQGEDAAAKPKRPRGGRRERERRERIARRQVAAAGGDADDGGSGQPPPPPPPPPQQQQAGDDFGAGFEPRTGAAAGPARATHAEGLGNGVGGDVTGAERPRRTRGGRREREKRERREARAAATAAAAGNEAGDTALVGHPEQDFGAGFGPSGTARGADGDADAGTYNSVDSSGDAGGARPKRATRGGRREREKRERLAARLAAATATAAAAAALDA